MQEMYEFVKPNLTLERFIELSRMPEFDINAKVSRMLIISWLILNKNLTIVNYILENDLDQQQQSVIIKPKNRNKKCIM